MTLCKHGEGGGTGGKKPKREGREEVDCGPRVGEELALAKKTAPSFAESSALERREVRVPRGAQVKAR